MKRLTAMKGETLVLVDEKGRPLVFPTSATPEVAGILTTPTKVRRSRKTNTGIADELVTLQPGDEGHAASSLRSVGFLVVEDSR